MNLQDEMFKKYLAELAAQRQNYVEAEPQQDLSLTREPQSQLPLMDERQQASQEQVDPLQASLEQKQAGTLEAQKRYADWLQGLAKRSSQAAAMQSEALAATGREALGSRAINQMGSVAMSLLNQPGLAKMYGEQAQDAGRRFGDSQKAGATQFGDYLAKTAGIEERALGGQLDAALKAEGMAVGALQKRETETMAKIRHAEEMAAKATTAAEKMAWEKEKQKLDADLRRDLAAVSASNARLFAEGKQAAKADEAKEKDIENLSKRLERYGFAEKAISAINKYTQPGVSIPGFGRDGSLVPDRLASPEALAVRANVLNLMDNLLRIRTGANAPESEVQRLNQIYTMLKSSSEDVVREGMKRLRDDTISYMTQDEAGYRPDVVEEYGRRGGFTSRKINSALASENPELDAIAKRRAEIAKRKAELSK